MKHRFSTQLLQKQAAAAMKRATRQHDYLRLSVESCAVRWRWNNGCPALTATLSRLSGALPMPHRRWRRLGRERTTAFIRDGRGRASTTIQPANPESPMPGRWPRLLTRRKCLGTLDKEARQDNQPRPHHAIPANAIQEGEGAAQAPVLVTVCRTRHCTGSCRCRPSL